MGQFTPDSYQILIVEDCAIWRRKLAEMYSRCLFGEPRECENIKVAPDAAEAVRLMKTFPQQFNLVSLDINLGSRSSLGLGNEKSKIAVTGLDILDQMQTLQRGAAVVVITGASHDSELPSAFTEENKEKDEARARTTLAFELQQLFPDAYRFFPKKPFDKSNADEKDANKSSAEEKDADIQNQISKIGETFTQAALFDLSEKRQKHLIKVDVPMLCVMIVLDDDYFEGHDENTGRLFAKPEFRCVPFDFFEESLELLQSVKIWDANWPVSLDQQRSFYYDAPKGSDAAAQKAFDRAKNIAKGNIILRYKPTSSLRCAFPRNTTTIPYPGKPKLTDVHKEFLLRIARHKIMNTVGGPCIDVNKKKTAKTASELRTRLRHAFNLRNDEQDPVSSKDPQTGKKLGHYDINMQVFLCSKNYINPPPKVKILRRKKVDTPNLVHLDFKEASVLISKAQLIHSIETEFSDTVKAGHVVRTIPESGEKISIGSQIILVLSKGPKQ